MHHGLMGGCSTRGLEQTFTSFVSALVSLACVSGLCFIECAADFRILGQSVFSRSHVMNTDLNEEHLVD